LAYAILMDNESAMKDFDKALSIDATYADAYFSKGSLLLNMNRLNEACAQFEAAALYGDADAAYIFNDLCK